VGSSEKIKNFFAKIAQMNELNEGSEAYEINEISEINQADVVLSAKPLMDIIDLKASSNALFSLSVPTVTRRHPLSNACIVETFLMSTPWAFKPWKTWAAS
jgi:hypothetical protein